tara:strand:+ start:175 stop:483 length:309 start_codon:yes stop_codon:yes gene_type:complete
MWLFTCTDTYLLFVSHGKTMRRLRNIEQLREAIRTEGRASILMVRLDRRANASSRRLARATVLDPMTSELPDHARAKVDSLEAKEAKLADALPDYMKKLTNG